MSHVWAGTPPAFSTVLGAGAVLSGTAQRPISTMVLFMELTRHVRACTMPLLLIVALVTLAARTVEPSSIFDACLMTTGLLSGCSSSAVDGSSQDASSGYSGQCPLPGGCLIRLNVRVWRMLLKNAHSGQCIQTVYQCRSYPQPAAG